MNESLLKEIFNVMGLTITSMSNFSMHEGGSFPSCFDFAIAHPMLKQPSLDSIDWPIYRLISTFKFISETLAGRDELYANSVIFQITDLPSSVSIHKFH